MKFLNHNLFTGDITVNGTTTLSTATGVTRATGDNSTHLATTAFVKAQNYLTAEVDTLDTVTDRNSVTTNSIGVGTVNIIGTTAGAELLTVDGTFGRLFTVTDDLSDSLFSVNTIAGLPVIEVFADNTINLGAFSNPITIDGSSNIVIPGTITASGYNDTNWNTAYNDRIVSAAVSGTTTKTLTLTQTDGGTISTSWTDINTDTDGYISNVSLVGSTLSFTSVGSAFSGIVDLSTLTPTVRTVYETVKNVSGATILKGTPLAVVAGQTSGNVSDVIPADAADPTKMPAIFIANQNIADQAEGEAVLFGNITGINTSAFTSGTTVYVAPGGGWTATKPVHPNLIQNLGVITKQHATNGGGIVTGVGRANALPNLTAGKIWVGSATYPIESTTVHVDEANGRVGIGTTSPAYKLDVNGNVRLKDAASELIINNATYSELNYGPFNYFRANGGQAVINGPSIAFLTGGTEKVRIDAAGNVGIGTTSPSEKLHVIGTTNTRVIIETQTNGGSSALRLDANPNYWEIKNYGASANLGITRGTTELLTIDNTGNVGIGTTAPTNKVQVANGNMSITSGYSFILADTDTNWRLGRNIIVESGNQLTSNTLQFIAANAVNEGWQFVNDDGFTVLEIGALTTARHVWINAGNLSVGVASPQEKIHVAGNVRIDGGSTAAILETNNAAAAEAGTTYRTFTTADHYAVFVDYVVYDAGRANMRTGTFRAVWSTGDVVYTDVSTVDLGATDNVVLSAAISGVNVNLIVTGPTDYTLKYNLKVIK